MQQLRNDAALNQNINWSSNC